MALYIFYKPDESIIGHGNVYLNDTMGTSHLEYRSHLKKVFWPKRCVGSSFQILDIHEYACGLKLGHALILNQNPNFEMASSLMADLPGM